VGNPALVTDREARFLRALVEEGVDFLVVGLAAAALQGAPAVTQDIDLWFRDLSDPGLLRALRRVGATYIPPGPSHPPLLAGGDASLFDVVVNVEGLGTFAQEARRAQRVRIGDVEMRVLPLARVSGSCRWPVSSPARGRPTGRRTVRFCPLSRMPCASCGVESRRCAGRGRAPVGPRDGASCPGADCSRTRGCTARGD
jgi:hypothetical protein